MFCKLDLECEQLHLQCIVVYKYIFIYNIEYMYTFSCGIIGPSHVGQNQYYNMCVYFTIHITVHVKKYATNTLRWHLKTRRMCTAFLPPCTPHFDGHAAVHCLVMHRNSKIVVLFAVKMPNCGAFAKNRSAFCKKCHNNVFPSFSHKSSGIPQKCGTLSY